MSLLYPPTQPSCLPTNLRSIASHHLSRPTNHVNRFGDSPSLPVTLEIPLTLAIPDSLANINAHSLHCSVLDVLGHDAVIGSIDIIGPYYDLFEESILSSQKLAASNSLITHIDDISTAVNAITTSVPQQHQLDVSSLVQYKQNLFELPRHFRFPCLARWLVFSSPVSSYVRYCVC